jgi:type IV pilus assembly protein PilQ
MLKDLPLIGWLFRTPYAPETEKNELIIFMTPRILNQEEAGLSDRSTSAQTEVSSTQL